MRFYVRQEKCKSSLQITIGCEGQMHKRHIYFLYYSKQFIRFEVAFHLVLYRSLVFLFHLYFSGEYLQNQINHSTLTISLDVHRTGSSFFFGLPHLMKLIDLSDGSNDRIISLRLTKRYHQKINQKIYALQKYVSFRMKVVQSLSLMQSDTSNIDIILNIILVTVQS